MKFEVLQWRSLIITHHSVISNWQSSRTITFRIHFCNGKLHHYNELKIWLIIIDYHFRVKPHTSIIQRCKWIYGDTICLLMVPTMGRFVWPMKCVCMFFHCLNWAVNDLNSKTASLTFGRWANDMNERKNKMTKHRFEMWNHWKIDRENSYRLEEKYLKFLLTNLFASELETKNKGWTTKEGSKT